MTTPEITLNLHQIFTTVKAHLLIQMAQCKGEFGACMYFDPYTGRKCAVGCLIPQSLYDRDMEERVMLQDNRPVREALEAAGVIPEGCWSIAVPFLMRMQGIHDTYPVSLWASALDTMEQEFFPETLKDTQ